MNKLSLNSLLDYIFIANMRCLSYQLPRYIHGHVLSVIDCEIRCDNGDAGERDHSVPDISVYAS